LVLGWGRYFLKAGFLLSRFFFFFFFFVEARANRYIISSSTRATSLLFLSIQWSCILFTFSYLFRNLRVQKLTRQLLCNIFKIET